jgi:hypothetical protein
MDKLTKLNEKIAMLEARRNQALQRMKSEDRARRTRQAILLGQYILSRHSNCGEDSEVAQKIIEHASRTLARPADRALLAELVPSDGSATAL